MLAHHMQIPASCRNSKRRASTGDPRSDDLLLVLLLVTIVGS